MIQLLQISDKDPNIKVSDTATLTIYNPRPVLLRSNFNIMIDDKGTISRLIFHKILYFPNNLGLQLWIETQQQFVFFSYWIQGEGSCQQSFTESNYFSLDKQMLDIQQCYSK